MSRDAPQMPADFFVLFSAACVLATPFVGWPSVLAWALVAICWWQIGRFLSKGSHEGRRDDPPQCRKRP